ncbi:MAG: TIGR04211 family SH3 domain-containing protein [Gammaproteobacteria bacterium]|nr:TIGR04211 family SH3 domain-containing protein [Gammaproteobacteria bacterium]
MRVRRLVTGLVLFLAALPGAYAETVYVTDELTLRLQAEPTDASAVVATLRSGDRLELLDKAGFFALVKTADGKQGWAKAGYLIAERPARARLQEMETELQALRAVAEPAQTELAKAQEQAVDLTQKLQASQRELSERGATIEQLEWDIAEYKQQLGIGDWKISWRWAAAAVLFAMLAGLALGMWWFDYRSRNRHGGFRIH